MIRLSFLLACILLAFMATCLVCIRQVQSKYGRSSTEDVNKAVKTGAFTVVLHLSIYKESFFSFVFIPKTFNHGLQGSRNIPRNYLFLSKFCSEEIVFDLGFTTHLPFPCSSNYFLIPWLYIPNLRQF